MTINVAKIDTQEILAAIKANLLAKQNGTFVPAVVEAKPVVNETMEAEIVQVDPTDYFTSRACFKDIKPVAPDVTGAHCLNYKNDNVILKGCAPMAQIASQIKGEFTFAGDDKGLAALPATPANEPAVTDPDKGLAALPATPANEPAVTDPDKDLDVSLCSPISEVIEDKADANTDPAPSEPDEDLEAAMATDVELLEPGDDEAVELIDPNFYRIRVDLFDNGVAKHTTQWTAKMSIQIAPDSNPDAPYVLYANFLSRARDFRRQIKDKGMWNEFYDDVQEMFEAEQKSGADYAVKPMISILKEGYKDDKGVKRYDLQGYTACMLWQKHGCEPEVTIIYQKFMEIVTLDTKFTAAKKTTLYKIGIFKDGSRAHLEPKRNEAKPMTVRGADFFAKR